MQRVDDLEDFMMIGDHREFQIIGGEDENGQVKLSIRRLEFARAWERVRQIQAEDCTISAEIMSINRGGALVNFEGLRGFLPGSHAPQGRNALFSLFAFWGWEKVAGCVCLFVFGDPASWCIWSVS